MATRGTDRAPLTEDEMHYHRIFSLNIFTTKPLGANIIGPPPDHMEMLKIPRDQAVRLTDDHKGRARWTSRDAILLSIRLSDGYPPLHHTRNLENILRQHRDSKPKHVFGVSPYLLSAAQDPMPMTQERDMPTNEELERMFMNGELFLPPEMQYPAGPSSPPEPWKPSYEPVKTATRHENQGVAPGYNVGEREDTVERVMRDPIERAIREQKKREQDHDMTN